MGNGGTSSTPPRVVIFSRGVTVDGHSSLPDSLQLVQVSSAYEAAAEVLCAPSLALVIELGALTRRHLGLLEVARGLDLEMIGVGALPAGMSAADLSGVRLVAAEALGESLRRLVEDDAPAGAPEAIVASAPPEAPAAQPVRLAPAKVPDEQRPDRPPRAGWQSESGPPVRKDAAETAPPLLTPDEIRALLEDQP